MGKTCTLFCLGQANSDCLFSAIAAVQRCARGQPFPPTSGSMSIRSAVRLVDCMQEFGSCEMISSFSLSRSSRSVRRPDGEVPVGASSAPVNHLPRPHSPPSSSTCERREDVRLSRHLLPTGSLDREGSSRLPGWDMWEEDPASFRDLPNPSQLRKR